MIGSLKEVYNSLIFVFKKNSINEKGKLYLGKQNNLKPS